VKQNIAALLLEKKVVFFTQVMLQTVNAAEMTSIQSRIKR